MNIAIERKVHHSFALSLGCLCVIGVFSWVSVARLRQDASWVEHSHEVSAELGSVVSAITDAERAENGYVITGRDVFLQTRGQSQEAAAAGLKRLAALTVDNPLQQQNLRALSAAVDKRLTAGAGVAEIRRSQGFEAASQAILAGAERGLHNAIRTVSDGMARTEQGLLADREARARRSATLAEAVILLGGLFAFAIVGLAVFAIKRDLAARKRAEDALREANDLLEIRVAERTADLLESNRRLQEGERLLEDMGRVAQVGGWEFDPTTGRGQWTSEVGRIHELDGDVEPSKNLGLEFYPGDSRIRIETAVQTAIREGTPYDLELEFVSAKGTRKWVRTISQPVLENGKVVRMRGSIQDISDRKLAETRLRAQLQRLDLLSQITHAIGERQDSASIFQAVVRTLEDDLPVDFGCICLYDANLHRLSVASVGVKTESLGAALGIARNAHIEIDQNGLSRCVRGLLVYESDIRAVPFAFPQRLSQGGLCSMVAAPLQSESRVFGILVVARTQVNGFSSADCEFLRQLSEHVALATHQANLYGALQQAYDDLRKTQQTVMQQERLRALGQMASGIAHDINNAISPVMLYTESLLEKEPDLSVRTREYLETIQRAIGDVAQTVSRMREFYREREPQLSLLPVQLNELADQVLDLTRARWTDMPQQRGVVIRLHKEFAPDLAPVMGVASEIREALTNLIFNAVDAMPQGGILTLRTRGDGALLSPAPVAAAAAAPAPAAATPVAAAPPVAVSAAAVPAADVVAAAAPAATSAPSASLARFACIEVIDTGVGMDEDTRRRCLEPFFTTKGERGTGLGLAMVYGTAQRNNARIEIDSAPGLGTTIRLVFPVEPAVLAVPLPPPSPPRPLPALRILVVDDDPLLLKSLRDTLEGDRHSIVTANGGSGGIEAFRSALAADTRFDVVITDLGMPHVDGRQVAAAVKTASRSTPVIMLTGWGQRLISEAEVPPHVDRLLSKPPKLRELREALAAVTPQSSGTA